MKWLPSNHRFTRALILCAAGLAPAGADARAAESAGAPVVGFGIAQQPPAGPARRVTVVLQLGDTKSARSGPGIYTFDPARATVSVRRVDVAGPRVVLQPAPGGKPHYPVAFAAIPVVPGATYRVDVTLRPGSIRLGSRSVAAPAYAPVAYIDVPAVTAAKDADIARVRAAFARVAPLPNVAQPATSATVLRAFDATCQTVKGTAASGQRAGDAVIYAGVVRGVASEAASGLDAMYPPFDAPATPVYLSTAPLVVTLFGSCDDEMHAFSSADDVLRTLRPEAPATPSPAPSSLVPPSPRPSAS